MVVLAGVTGGLVCGFAFGLIFALLSTAPHFGWAWHLTMPTFFLMTPISGLFIGAAYQKYVGV